MKQENKDKIGEKLVRELAYLAAVFFVCLIMMRLIFSRDSILVIVKLLSALFWMFVLPGYSLTFWCHRNLDFLTRVVVGVGISAALMAVGGYYLGLLGLHVRYHGIVIPVFLILCGISTNIILHRKSFD